MLQKNLADSYEAIEDSPFAESVCGVIYAVKKKNSNDTATYALKTIQTHVVRNRRSPIEDIKIALNADLLRTEIGLLRDLTLELGALEEKHIIPILDYGVWHVSDKHKNEPCFVMPCGSSSLNDYVLEGCFSLNLQQWCMFAEQLLTALNALSQTSKETKFQSHRDIKPTNIILWNDKLYLIDFGIGRVNDKGYTTLLGWGTKEWIAPEQGIPHGFGPNPENGEIGPRFHAGPSVDIYSTAHVLYWICVKRNLRSQDEICDLFKGGNPNESAVASFEKVGGISEDEIKRFKSALLQLHKREQDQAESTIVPLSSVYPLPNIDKIVDDIVLLLKSMLEIKACDRATAPEAFRAMRAIQERFNPKVEKIEIQGPTEIYCNDAYALTIVISGEGLEKDNSWWEFLIDGVKARCTTFARRVKNSFYWAGFLPALSEECTVTCVLNVFVGTKIEHITHEIRIVYSPDDLWNAKRYVDALKIYPDKKEWIKYIRTQITQDAEERKKWLVILDAVFLSLKNDDNSYLLFKETYFNLKSMVISDVLRKKEEGILKQAKAFYGKQEYHKAFFLFKQLAEAGNAGAQNSLGDCYYYGHSVSQDYKKAVEWFTLAAQQGNADAQFNLGCCYDNGQGVTQDYEKAVEWYTLAAQQGNADAQFNLGCCYKNGQGVTQDYEKAVEWYTLAAKQGDASAQCNLGYCYDKGQGVVQDYEKAVEWYTLAVKQGNASAQCNLGCCYKNGQGVTQDYEKAVEWYTLAAKQGNATAQCNLGNFYKNGQGVLQDNEKAIVWYRKAAGGGSTMAQDELRKLGETW